MNSTFRPGDVVQVKSPNEILQTLGSDGTLDQLPFMPEMRAYCGKRFRISKRALNVCNSGPHPDLRQFIKDDVFLLEDLRCSGMDHDGCQKGCLIFWREAWLRKPDEAEGGVSTPDGATRLSARLKTVVRPNFYFCQASELLKFTELLSLKTKLGNCLREIQVGNCGVFEMVGRLIIWLIWKVRHVLFGMYARGNRKSTPTDCLGLQPGERVQVKSLESIKQTLNETARNRGLVFFPNMRLACNQMQTVERRLDKIIVDGTGEMRKLQNTVYLDNSHCGCSYIALGGCTRGELAYWREIWLQRPEASGSPKS